MLRKKLIEDMYSIYCYYSLLLFIFHKNINNNTENNNKF